MKGGESARWVDEDMADYFSDKVKTFVTEHKNEPFFLYYGLHEPHVPRAPHSRFVGATDMGPRGDAIVEADWCVGELLKHLEKEGILENTLIFFTSDNGPVLDDGYKDQAVERLGNHKPTGGLRGGKYSLFDAGTHVPLFVYWKGKVQPVRSDAIFCQMDIMASLAAMLGVDIPEGLDTQNHLDVMLGKSQQGRDELVLEADMRLMLRSGKWAFIPPYKGKERNLTGNELGNGAEYMLFDMEADPNQTTNVAASHPDVVKQLKERFVQLTGRTLE